MRQYKALILRRPGTSLLFAPSHFGHHPAPFPVVAFETATNWVETFRSFIPSKFSGKSVALYAMIISLFETLGRPPMSSDIRTISVYKGLENEVDRSS